jgi:hypothetical protein
MDNRGHPILIDDVSLSDIGNDLQKALEKQKVEGRAGRLPKGRKWYLLNKLFGFRPCEVA